MVVTYARGQRMNNLEGSLWKNTGLLAPKISDLFSDSLKCGQNFCSNADEPPA